MTGARLAAIHVPGDAGPWVDLGFAVVDEALALANGAVRFGSAACGLELEPPGVDATSIEGIVLSVGCGPDAVEHPNGAIGFDHVVVMTDSLERTSAAVAATLGLEQRRVRETGTVRQAFHRFAATDDDAKGCIIEIVENPRVVEPAIWGCVATVADLDALVLAAGGLVNEPKPAVQPGRRIATVARSARLPIAVAFMSS